MASTNWKGFLISAVYKGDRAAPWKSDKMPANYNRHLVTVRKDGKQTSFDFWASMMDPEIRERSDLLSAFRCFLSDAISGMGSFSDFCGDLGYDEDSREAERIYHACEKSAEKAQRVLGGLDIYDTINSLPD